MENKNNRNIAQLSRDLDWVSHGREYKHLLILLNYMPLNKALTLILSSEES